jgi:hypothetical protein
MTNDSSENMKTRLVPTFTSAAESRYRIRFLGSSGLGNLDVFQNSAIRAANAPCSEILALATESRRFESGLALNKLDPSRVK